MLTGRNEVLKYMTKNVDDYVDHKTNEVNATRLAEDACDHFHDWEEDDSIDQRYYDLAYMVAIAKEKELNEK